MAFSVLSTRCHTKGPKKSTGSYIWDFSFRNTSRRFVMFLNHNSQSLFGECRSMLGILIYWFLFMGFSVLPTRCHIKRSYQSTGFYIRDFSSRNT